MPCNECSTCDRCNKATNATIMSKFNRDTLCMACKQDEMDAPNYQRADTTEFNACMAGNYNFPGIGLAPEDTAFLAARRKARV